MRPVRTTARTLLSGIFVLSGARAVAHPERLAPQAKKVTDRMGPVLARTDHRLPSTTEGMVRLNGAVQLAGGLLLATGYLTRPAAAALAGTLVPTTLAGHPYWTQRDPVRRSQDQLQFLKNLGLIGGLLLAAADTEGRPGLRWRTGRAFGSGRRSVQRAARAARRDTRIALRSAAVARRLPS